MRESGGRGRLNAGPRHRARAADAVPSIHDHLIGLRPSPRARGLASRALLALTAALLVLVPAAFALHMVAGRKSAEPARQRPLAIRGDLRVALRPGVSLPLNLVLSNRYHFTLQITRLTVRASVDRRHRAAGCSVRRDFAARQLAFSAYPIRLPRGRTRRLTQLGVHPLPRIRMRALARTNQDACKGASLRLSYSARARKPRPAGRAAAARASAAGVRDRAR